jgi:hypothetical protein
MNQSQEELIDFEGGINLSDRAYSNASDAS